MFLVFFLVFFLFAGFTYQKFYYPPLLPQHLGMWNWSALFSVTIFWHLSALASTYTFEMIDSAACCRVLAVGCAYVWGMYGTIVSKVVLWQLCTSLCVVFCIVLLIMSFYGIKFFGSLFLHLILALLVYLQLISSSPAKTLLTDDFISLFDFN